MMEPSWSHARNADSNDEQHEQQNPEKAEAGHHELGEPSEPEELQADGEEAEGHGEAEGRDEEEIDQLRYSLPNERWVCIWLVAIGASGGSGDGRNGGSTRARTTRRR